MRVHEDKVHRLEPEEGSRVLRSCDNGKPPDWIVTVTCLSHVTDRVSIRLQATDSKQVRVVIGALMDSLLNRLLSDVGLM